MFDTCHIEIEALPWAVKAQHIKFKKTLTPLTRPKSIKQWNRMQDPSLMRFSLIPMEIRTRIRNYFTTLNHSTSSCNISKERKLINKISTHFTKCNIFHAYWSTISEHLQWMSDANNPKIKISAFALFRWNLEKQFINPTLSNKNA